MLPPFLPPISPALILVVYLLPLTAWQWTFLNWQQSWVSKVTSDNNCPFFVMVRKSFLSFLRVFSKKNRQNYWKIITDRRLICNSHYRRKNLSYFITIWNEWVSNITLMRLAHQNECVKPELRFFFDLSRNHNFWTWLELSWVNRLKHELGLTVVRNIDKCMAEIQSKF